MFKGTVGDSEPETLHHESVLAKEALAILSPGPGKTIVDATVGLGGHSRLILETIQPTGRLIGIDRDDRSLAEAEKRLHSFKDSLVLIHDNFANLGNILESLKVQKLDGILFDLGLSSFQLSEADRGFSFLREGPLDMRMDLRGRRTAADLVNHKSEKELDRILWEFGEERWHRRIAQRIAKARKRAPITTTTQLAELVTRAIPRATFTRIHPATRTFMALRIAVNQELEALDQAIRQALDFLNPGARIVVISFHSLEDRIVKNCFREAARERRLVLVTKKPITPSLEEMRKNPRSRGAKLRSAEKPSP
ncbi:MAG: 16S rRNA (cytosine(1402)-N(4))-methyltransferase RsmH [Candidatus Omnitrophica bacterium]|nr:16S rRNA (cytosine(1402)-N(4))-methyltransferase RsmH [Candidatus Omnitrophota bacterium]